MASSERLVGQDACRQLGHLAGALGVGRPSFQAHHVGVLVELQFGGILDGDDALLVGDMAGKGVQKRRLAAARATGNRNGTARPHSPNEKLLYRLVERTSRFQLGQRHDAPREGANGEQRPIEGERRQHRVDAMALGQAGAGHGRRLIDPPA